MAGELAGAAAFDAAVAALRTAVLRPEVRLEDLPSPSRLAPYAHAVGAAVELDDLTAADGRLVLLHDPAAPEAWEGDTRVVIYVRAAVDADMAADPLLPGVGWSWLVEALTQRGAAYTAAGGTVTRTASVRFGALSRDEESAELEMRASWTVGGAELGRDPEDRLPAHLQAWTDVLCAAAGLPPPGVAAFRLAETRRPIG